MAASAWPVDFLARCAQAHSATGREFAPAFDEYFTHHYVFKTPVYFMMARAHPTRDAWIVYWADTIAPDPQLSMIATFLDLAPYDRAEVAWCRGLRGSDELKYYSTARLRRLIGRHRRPNDEPSSQDP